MLHHLLPANHLDGSLTCACLSVCMGMRCHHPPRGALSCLRERERESSDLQHPYQYSPVNIVKHIGFMAHASLNQF